MRVIQNQRKWAIKFSSIFHLYKEEIKEVFQILMGSLFIAVLSQISFYLPFTPVPFTLQTFAIMFIGYTQGSRLGLKSVACHLVQGALGFPVWAGGVSGFSILIGSTGGYLIGYLFLVYGFGKVFERGGKNQGILAFGILLLLSTFQLLAGSLWMIPFAGVTNSFKYGFFPFILTESFKVSLIFTSYKIFKKKEL